MQEKFIVAIDGPAGAGKSTVAKILAEKLSYIYIDTGAMYRAIAWKCLQVSEKPTQETIEELVQNTSVKFVPNKNGTSVYVDDIDVTEAIRTPEVSANVSAIAQNEMVRKVLTAMQQEMGKSGGVVMDGRDIGTCVFPEAKYKIYLTATVQERAERRYKELIAKGYNCELAKLQEEIAARDHSDMTRAISPLTKALDAIEIDSSTLTIQETVDLLYGICVGGNDVV